jgi:antitoxin component YwqK of YwqJK toxin-antitoxin module
LLRLETNLFYGTLLEKILYVHGKREGKAQGFHSKGSPAWDEEYSANCLVNGSYYSQKGDLLSSVKEGKGIRSIFDDSILSSQQEIVDGVPNGKITLFEKDGSIERTYFILNGKKEGTEQRFFPDKKPRIQIEWKDGAIHGTVITWYQNGAMQSKKELRGNIKQGLTMAWYPDGSIMLVEEYENDTLKKGRYHKRGERAPVSQVNSGTGVATLFDEDGIVTEKIKYHEGKPQVE